MVIRVFYQAHRNYSVEPDKLIWHFGGIIPSDYVIRELTRLGLPMSERVRQRIEHYRQIVPRTNAKYRSNFELVKDAIDSFQRSRYEAQVQYWGPSQHQEAMRRVDAVLNIQY